nr:RluA family pseudouridine synthase [uncultured Olleya sp.]
MKTTQTHIVPSLNQTIRLQEYGVGIFDTIATKSALKKVLKKQFITVNGSIATTATFIKGGETIVLNLPENNTLNNKLKLKLDVLFEDNYLAVIHKPAGILVSGNTFKTIANALLQNLKPSTLDDATQPQPVHRLDYATTGILLIGKTSSSIRALNTLFKTRAITKSYYAITIGNMLNNGSIKTNIDDKTSHSDYQVCQTVISKRFETLNLVKLNPKTGRRHQLRKHLFSIGHPILGDQTYGFESLILKGKGLYLHAYSLAFTHPFTNTHLVLTSQLPKRFTKIFPDFKA